MRSLVSLPETLASQDLLRKLRADSGRLQVTHSFHASALPALGIPGGGMSTSQGVWLLHQVSGRNLRIAGGISCGQGRGAVSSKKSKRVH